MNSIPMRYYKLNEILLIIVGQWPFRGPEIPQFLSKLSVNSVLLLVLSMQTTYVAEHKFAMLNLIEELPLFIAMALITFLSLSFCVKSDDFEDLWKIMLDDWAAERNFEETKLKESYAAVGYLLTKLLTVFLGIGTVFFIIITSFLSNILDFIVSGNETHPHVLPFPTFSVFMEPELFYTVLTFEQITVVVIVLFSIANQAMLCVHMQHVFGMFAVIGYHLQHVLPNKISIADNVSVDKIYFQSLVLCIKRHQQALQFCAILESYYGFAFFIVLLGTILSMSPTLAQLEDTDLTRDYRNIIQILLTLGFLLIINYFGQKLTNSGATISEKIYATPWYRCSPELQKLIVIILRRCENPCQISAFNLYPASFYCFRVIMQTAVSYCMALRQFR